MLTAAIFFLVALALRVPFRSQFAYHWDSAQFALAIQHYDLRIGLPHRPGYFIYVMLGRVVNLLIKDPHAALVWISVIMGAALTALGYLLGRMLFGRSCGIATAVTLATSPLCWFHSEVALTTIVDGALVTATILACWMARRSGGSWGYVIVASVLVAAVSGVRLQSGLLLAPVWLYALSLSSGQRGGKLIVAATISLLVCVAWFVPMIAWSGGWRAYWELLVSQMEVVSPLTPWKGGVGAAVTSMQVIFTSFGAGLQLAGIVFAVELSLWWLEKLQDGRRAWLRAHRAQLTLLALWLAPMIVFGVAMYTTMPGYVLGYFPAVAVLTGLGVSRSVERISVWMHGRRQWAWTVVAGSIVLINALAFLLPSRMTRVVLGGLPLARTQISEHDWQLSQWMKELRSRFSPNEVLVCHDRQLLLWGFRHFQYHLPGYVNCFVGRDRALAPPYNRKLWYAQHWRMDFADEFDTKGRKVLILVVPPGGTPGSFSRLFDLRTVQEIKIPGTASLYIVQTADAVRKDSG